MNLRRPTLLSALCLLAACGSSGGGNKAPNQPPVSTECSVAEQKQTTLEIARDWYLWNDRLPASVDLDGFATVDDLLQYLMSFSPAGPDSVPVDRFSSIGPAAADQQFFGEGKFEGFGFGYRFEAADDMRITRVYAGSPAAGGGLARGQQILALNGRSVADIVADEGSAGLFAILATSPVTFSLRPVAGEDFDTTVARDIVTIDPIPQTRLIPREGLAPIGYLEFVQFISTAEPELDTVFADFRANDVTDIIIDLRYNGGGLVTTAELLGDLLGGAMHAGEIFTETRFNADRSAFNEIRRFVNILDRSVSVSRLVIIATRSTASASEMVANGMAPHVEVAIVGDDTVGKPIGQAGFEFCENVLRITAFQLFNADGFGDYFGGLPVTPGCEAPDDLSVAVGADEDPNMVEALGYLDTGACPAAAAAGLAGKPARPGPPAPSLLRGSPARVYSNSL